MMIRILMAKMHPDVPGETWDIIDHESQIDASVAAMRASTTPTEPYRAFRDDGQGNLTLVRIDDPDNRLSEEERAVKIGQTVRSDWDHTMALLEQMYGPVIRGESTSPAPPERPKGESLRTRLKRLGGFTDADFVTKNDMSMVEHGYDGTGTIVLIGKTGRTCRASLAFPIGHHISFLGGPDSVMGHMMIEDLGTHAGDPEVYLVLSIPTSPSLGTRDWALSYWCSNVDQTWIY